MVTIQELMDLKKDLKVQLCKYLITNNSCYNKWLHMLYQCISFDIIDIIKNVTISLQNHGAGKTVDC